MKAEVVTYETEEMTNSKRSILSKTLFGYTDKTKKAKYIYERNGILDSILHVKITKKTFIVSAEDAKKIRSIIKALGAKVKSWRVEISKGLMQKSYG